jgi:hypothetical protein
MNRRWHFYELATGRLTGSTFSAPNDSNLAEHIPVGCGAIEGVRDVETQRVDLETGQIVDRTV